MEENLFNDLVAAFNEAIEHDMGNIKLNSNVVTIPDDELEIDQFLFGQISRMSKPDKQKVIQYAESLLRA